MNGVELCIEDPSSYTLGIPPPRWLRHTEAEGGLLCSHPDPVSTEPVAQVWKEAKHYNEKIQI